MSRLPTGIGADAERSTEVVEDDRRIRKGARQIGQFGNLRMIEPGIERQSALAEFGETLAETLVQQQMLKGIGVGVAHTIARIPAGRMADATEARTRQRDAHRALRQRPHPV